MPGFDEAWVSFEVFLAFVGVAGPQLRSASASSDADMHGWQHDLPQGLQAATHCTLHNIAMVMKHMVKVRDK